MNGVQIYDPSVWLNRDPEVEEKMLRDADIAHAVGYRRHLIAGRTWKIQPKVETPRAPMAVTVGTQLVEQIKHFTEARFQLARAFFSGARFGRIHGEHRTLTLGDGKPRVWWVPNRIEDLDKRMFRKVPHNDGKSIYASWEVWDIAGQKWIPETIAEANRTIRHVYQDDQASLGHGRGLRDALGWWWYAKTHVFQESLQAIERFAQGIVTARIDGVRDAATGLPNEELIRSWQDVLENLRSRHVLVFDKSDEVQMMPGSGEGWQTMEAIRTELKSTIFTLVLGANLTTSASEGGSYALAEIQENSTEALIQFDRRTLEESLTDDLIGCIWKENWRNMNELGVAYEVPSFTITQEKIQDPRERAGVAETLNRMGVKLSLEDVLEQTGFRKPENGEEVVEPQSPDAGGMGGMGGFGAPGGMGGGGQPEQPQQPPQQPQGQGEQMVRGREIDWVFEQKRHPAGSGKGGQFAPKEGGDDGGKTDDKKGEKPEKVRDTAAKQRRDEAAKEAQANPKSKIEREGLKPHAKKSIEEEVKKKKQIDKALPPEEMQTWDDEAEPLVGQEPIPRDEQKRRVKEADEMLSDQRKQLTDTIEKSNASLPEKATQTVGGKTGRDLTIDDLFQQVPAAHAAMQDMLNNGNPDSLEVALGADVVDHSLDKDDPKREKNANQTEKMLDDNGPPLVIIGPPKTADRSEQKVKDKYGGDASRLQDTVRATVCVNNPGEIATTIEQFEATMAAQGFEPASQYDNRYERALPTGYRDVATTFRHKETGLICEIQFNTKSMQRAKDGNKDGVLSGHEYYDAWRILDEKGDENLSNEEKTKKKFLEEKQQDLYSAAYYHLGKTQGTKQ